MALGLGDRRGQVFAGVVVLLAVVGVYLTLGPDPGGPQQGTEQVSADRTAEPAAPQTPVATASNAAFDIYSFLPMSKEELAAAADVAQRFITSYGTYRFDEDPAVYTDRLSVFTTADLAAALGRAVASPGTVEQNTADALVSEGSAQVKEIREVDRSSVIFVVTGTQRVTAKSGPTERSEEYAVTLTQIGSDWRVHDLQPADAGQEGDPPTGIEGVR
ncbi:hypothetical protein [Streptosporangium sp. KLBMP 9127]|nr:hypothetical protein [Streptosporangium sp. KLBMP 9127]